MQYSLRGVLLGFAIAAVWLAWLQVLPHVAIFLLGPLLILASVILLVQYRHCEPTRSRRAIVLSFSIFCWLVFYIVSVGPAAALNSHGVIPHQLVATVYAPHLWVYQECSFSGPLVDYIQSWRVCWGKQDRQVR